MRNQHIFAYLVMISYYFKLVCQKHYTYVITIVSNSNYKVNISTVLLPNFRYRSQLPDNALEVLILLTL